MLATRIKNAKRKLWICPTCKRKFERHGQSHSCKPFPLAQHFENKSEGKMLYQYLKQTIKSEIGSFKVESLECCIHFVSTFTFVAIKILKNRIRVDFSLNRKIKNNRFSYFTPMSTNRYLYCVDVMTKDDIDEELISWIKEARDKKA